MAILDDIPGVSAEILVDNVPLHEYTDEDENDDEPTPNTTTKYVECVSGANFSVRYSINGYLPLLGADCIVSHLSMDGKHVESSVHRIGNSFFDLQNIFAGARSNEGGLWKLTAFQFADIVTTDDGPAGKPSPELKQLGTIIVELRRGQYLAEGLAQIKSNLKLQDKPVHEKHLKGEAISNQVQHGASTPIAPTVQCSVRYLDRGVPFATFQFRYRSRKSLQALYLIPRSPTPVPLEDRPEETLNREELLELLRRQKRRQEEQTEIKKEIKRERNEADEDDDELVVISSRRPKKQLKASMNVDAGIETIDLTND